MAVTELTVRATRELGLRSRQGTAASGRAASVLLGREGGPELPAGLVVCRRGAPHCSSEG